MTIMETQEEEEEKTQRLTQHQSQSQHQSHQSIIEQRYPSDYQKVNQIYKQTFGNDAPFLFLHPDQDRPNYTNNELSSLNQRDFATRWLICSSTVHSRTNGPRSVFLRTRFTDNHEYESHLNYIRDYYKATCVTENFTAAKTTVTELLRMFFAFEKSQYYSFAVTVASGLSNYGENISFQGSNTMLLQPTRSSSSSSYSSNNNNHNQDQRPVSQKKLELEARRKLCLLMDVLFSKVAMYRFLVQDEGSNTYRLVHCGTKTSTNKKPLWYAVFSFLIQLCLTGYVVMENLDAGIQACQLRNLPLAILTLIYSSMIAHPSLEDVVNARKVYDTDRLGPLQLADLFVNQFLTVVLLISGFFVILIQESYIEAVLNTAALLFIPEIDDQLPQLLGFDPESIIKNYVTYKSLEQFDERSLMEQDEVRNKLARHPSIGVPFQDFYLTNIKEQASYPEDGISFTPYQVIAGKNCRNGHNSGHQVDPSNFVTDKCLISKLVWSYTDPGEPYTNSTHPRIGYLKIEKLGGGGIVEIFRKGQRAVDVSDVKHSLKGVFIITTFQMSDDIFRLRVCGSPTAKDFVNAFDYYSLWPLTSNAMDSLNKAALREEKGKDDDHPIIDLGDIEELHPYFSMSRVRSSRSYSSYKGNTGGFL